MRFSDNIKNIKQDGNAILICDGNDDYLNDADWSGWKSKESKEEKAEKEKKKWAEFEQLIKIIDAVNEETRNQEVMTGITMYNEFCTNALHFDHSDSAKRFLW